MPFAVIASLVATVIAAAPSAQAATVTSQVVTVKATNYTTTYAVLEAWQRQSDGRFRRVAGPWTARLGYTGLSAPGTRVEGDGSTPAGRFRVRPGFGIAVNPGTRMPYVKIDNLDWWVGDPKSPYYNRRHRCLPGTCPFDERRSEHMIDYPVQYKYGAVIKYNWSPVVPGAGSGIFLHVNGSGATAGCVSVSESRMTWLLRWMRPATTTSYDPLISIGVGSAAYRPIPDRYVP